MDNKVTKKMMKLINILNITLFLSVVVIMAMFVMILKSIIQRDTPIYFFNIENEFFKFSEVGVTMENVTNLVIVSVMLVLSIILICKFLIDREDLKDTYKRTQLMDRIKGYQREEVLGKEKEWETKVIKLKEDKKILDLEHEEIQLNKRINVVYEIKRGDGNEGVCKIQQFNIKDEKLKKKIGNKEKVYYYEIFV